MSRAWAEIDLDALGHNLHAIRRRTGNAVATMLVVKADAYGHGAVAVAHHALRCGVAALGVGTSAEALELRRAGVRAPILVLGTVVDEEASEALRHGVHVAIHSADRCQMLEDLAQRLGVRAWVHLKIDSGMGRLGVMPSRALELLRRIKSSSHLQLTGVMTHLASPLGALDERTNEQLEVFDRAIQAARRANLLEGRLHACNSAGIFTGLGTRYDMVRPGISAYGILPEDLPGHVELQPVLSLHTQVVFLKDLPAGASVGYGSTWRSDSGTRIAILGLGYSDGVSWRLSNRGQVLVRGRRAPIIGRVSMDYLTVDVGSVPGVRVGDTVTLIGRQGDQEIRVEELARLAETIPYELTCSVGKRVERVYRGGETVLTPAPPPTLAAAPALPRAGPRVRAKRVGTPSP
jgi:alanine racemase